MKFYAKILLPSLLVASSASAELAWVKSHLWQAPYNNVLNLKVTTDFKNLSKRCKEYREIVEAAPGKTFSSASEIESARTDSGTLFGKFSAQFKVDGAASAGDVSAELSKANESVLERSSQDKLPYYTLKSAEIIPTFVPRGEVEVVYTKQSLTALSVSVGVSPARVQVLENGVDSKIKVMGVDLACDLAEGNAVLDFNSSAKIKISREDQVRSDEFYRGLELATEQIYAKKSTVAGRAALFGFRMGESLAPLRLDNARSEEMVGTLTESLFDANMQRSKIWRSFNGKFNLSVDGTAEGPLKIRLGN